MGVKLMDPAIVQGADQGLIHRLRHRRKLRRPGLQALDRADRRIRVVGHELLKARDGSPNAGVARLEDLLCRSWEKREVHFRLLFATVTERRRAWWRRCALWKRSTAVRASDIRCPPLGTHPHGPARIHRRATHIGRRGHHGHRHRVLGREHTAPEFVTSAYRFRNGAEQRCVERGERLRFVLTFTDLSGYDVSTLRELWRSTKGGFDATWDIDRRGDALELRARGRRVRGDGGEGGAIFSEVESNAFETQGSVPASLVSNI